MYICLCSAVACFIYELICEASVLLAGLVIDKNIVYLALDAAECTDSIKAVCCCNRLAGYLFVNSYMSDIALPVCYILNAVRQYQYQRTLTLYKYMERVVVLLADIA